MEKKPLHPPGKSLVHALLMGAMILVGAMLPSGTADAATPAVDGEVTQLVSTATQPFLANTNLSALNGYDFVIGGGGFEIWFSGDVDGVADPVNDDLQTITLELRLLDGGGPKPPEAAYNTYSSSMFNMFTITANNAPATTLESALSIVYGIGAQASTVFITWAASDWGLTDSGGTISGKVTLTPPTGETAYQISSADLHGNFTQVPEPGLPMMAGVAGAALLILRRRQTHQ